MNIRNPAPTQGATVEIDIPLLLPDAPDAADTCTARLLAELTGRDGVTWVHVLGAEDDQPAKLCIHFDPDALSLGRIKELATAVGAQVTARFGHVHWQLEGITSARRARTVADYLLGQTGVQKAGYRPVARSGSSLTGHQPRNPLCSTRLKKSASIWRMEKTTITTTTTTMPIRAVTTTMVGFSASGPS